MPFDIFDVIELRCQGVVDINNEDLPIRLALVKQRHDTEDLDLLDLPNISDLLADLTNVQRIVVALGLSLRVCLRRVLPGLMHDGRKAH